MKNFSIRIDDKEYWISRSVAVVALLFTIDKDEDICILANRRGSGTPDFQGLWNCPCGYLDYNETTLEAVRREVLEETGVICPESMKLMGVDSDPQSNRQNVTIHYCGFIETPVRGKQAGGEKNEVIDIKWIKITKLSNYHWAFHHDKLIIETLKRLMKNKFSFQSQGD